MRRARRVAIVCALPLLTIVSFASLAACGGSSSTEGTATATASGARDALTGTTPDERVSLGARDIAFDAAELSGSAGRVIEISLRNDGVLPHDFTIDRLSGDVSPAAARAPGKFDVHVVLDARERAQVLVRATAPGRYVYYCSVPGHRGSGMEGTLTVR